MRLGLIARADSSGLATQTWEAYRHLNPAKTLVIDVSHMADDGAHCNKQIHPERFPNAVWNQGWLPTEQVVFEFLQDLDAVLSCETFYSPRLPDLARGLGVRTVLQPNFEFLDWSVQPDLWAAPSLWRFGEIPNEKCFLPVPIATDRFTTPNELGAGHFLHVVGRPAMHDRNGTEDLLKALQYVESDITLRICCQHPGYVGELIAKHGVRTPDNVELVIEPGNVENYWDLYDGGTLVMPRRFGGLCLPVNEALGARMPVIMPNISPNNTWLPSEWLVEADRVSEFRAKQRIEVYGVHPPLLAGKIDQFAEPGFYARARYEAETLAKGLSWDALRPEYEQILQGS
jgi:glycosyltransferase involved in cell wall biosynthesis